MTRFELIVNGRCFRLFGKIWTKANDNQAVNCYGETILMHPKRRVRRGVV